jgi:hypothetical protein
MVGDNRLSLENLLSKCSCDDLLFFVIIIFGGYDVLYLYWKWLGAKASRIVVQC